MAEYHCTVKTISRGAGRSAIAAAAYRSGSALEDHRTGLAHDYTRKQGIVLSEIVLPESAPEALRDRATLWNMAEKAEVRSNARTARECLVALPHELNDDERQTLTRNFAQTLCDRYGVAVDFAIHRPDRGGDDRNVHAHLLFTTREITADGFGKKTRSLDDRELGRLEIRHLRELWQEQANQALEKAGHEARIDCRSFKDRGIELEPTIHLGPYATDLERQGKRTELGDINRLVAEDNQERILAQVTRNQAVFTEADVAKALARQGQDPADRHAILADPEVIRLDDAKTGERLWLYTTQSVRAQEEAVLALATSRAQDDRHYVSHQAERSGLKGRELTQEQKRSFEHAIAPGALKVIEGKAGTGKSYTMGSVREAFEADGYRVIGLAPTNTVASDMRRDGFKSARTVHSLLWHAEQAKDTGVQLAETKLDRNTVLIVDEAGMLGTKPFERLLTEAERAGSKVILLGDEGQLSSIERGGMFGVFKERFGSAALTTVRRQESDWQRQASQDFGSGRFQEGLKAYSDKGYVLWSQTLEQSRAALVEKWRADTAQTRGKTFAFAYTNQEVDALNQAMQQVEVERGRVKNLRAIQTDKGELLIGEGDRLQVRGTDKRMGLMNGQAGTLEKITTGRDGKPVLTCQLDSGERVTIDTARFNQVSLGYAGTIYKGQGKTLDQTYLLHTSHWHEQASYVAMTRARQAVHVFTSQDQAKDLDHLANQMARRRDLGASLRYAVGRDRTEITREEPMPSSEQKTPRGFTPKFSGERQAPRAFTPKHLETPEETRTRPEPEREASPERSEEQSSEAKRPGGFKPKFIKPQERNDDRSRRDRDKAKDRDRDRDRDRDKDRGLGD